MPAPLNELDYLKTWVLYFICTALVGAVVGAGVGAFAGGLVGSLGYSRTTGFYVVAISTYIIGIPISYLFFRVFVKRLITRKFVPQTSVESPQSAA